MTGTVLVLSVVVLVALANLAWWIREALPGWQDDGEFGSVQEFKRWQDRISGAGE